MGAFEYLADSSDDAWSEIREFLDRSDEKRKQRLGRELARIQLQLNEREAFHEEVVNRIEGRIDQYVKELRQLYSRPFGGNRESREDVKEALGELYADLHQAKRQHWQDRQALEQERRDIIRQLEELDATDTARYLL